MYFVFYNWIPNMYIFIYFLIKFIAKRDFGENSLDKNPQKSLGAEKIETVLDFRDKVRRKLVIVPHIKGSYL